MRGGVLAALLLAKIVSGASYTATQSGNWSSSATWGGSGIPGSGDTAVIGAFTVTIPAGSSVTVGNPGAAGDAINLNNTSSKLVVNGNLTLQGHLRCSSGASVDIVVVSSPVTVTLKSSAAVTPTMAAGLTTSKWTFTGQPGNRVLITTDTSAGGNPGYMDASNGGQLLWTHVILSGLGSNTQTALINARNATWDYVLIKDSGLIQIQPTTATATVDINHLDYRLSRRTSQYGFQYSHGSDLAGGVRRIRNSTFVSTQPSYLLVNAYDLVWDNVVIDQANLNLSTNGRRQSFQNVFFSGEQIAGQSNEEAVLLPRDAGISFENCAFITKPSNTENNHYCHEKFGTIGVGPNTWNNIVVDGVNGSGSGDFVMPGGAHSIANSLFINQFGNVSDGLYAGAKGTIHNITAWNNTHLVNGGVIVISENGPDPAKASAHRNNIFSSTLHGICEGTSVTNNWNRQTAYSLDYNAYWDMQHAENLVSPITGVLSYVYRPSVAMTLTSGALTAGTNATNVVAAGAKFITDGVRTGDMVYARGTYSMVLAVNSETQLALDGSTGGGSGISGLSPGDTITIFQGYWNDGGRYGDPDKGRNDIAADPKYRDTTRSVLNWDTGNGGPGTLAHVRAEIVKLNGYDASGTPAVFNPNYSLSNFLNYVRYGFMPTNPLFKNAGSPADGSPDLGAIPMQQFGAVPAITF